MPDLVTKDELQQGSSTFIHNYNNTHKIWIHGDQFNRPKKPL